MDLTKYADQEYGELRYNKQNLLDDSFVVLSNKTYFSDHTPFLQNMRYMVNY